MEYFVLSTTCFGLYIGHHQVSINDKFNANLMMANVEAETCS